MKQRQGAIERRARQSYKPEFKAEIVRMITQGGKTLAAVAREYDLTPSAVRNWVRRTEIDAVGGQAGTLTTAEREELLALRKRVRRLEMEQEILRKATAFFAREQL